MNDINYPETDIEKLNKKIPNRFILSIAVAKRAKQLKEGIKPLVNYNPDEPYSYILIALKEISEGKINVDIIEKEDEDTNKLNELDQFLEQEIAKEKEEFTPLKTEKK